MMGEPKIMITLLESGSATVWSKTDVIKLKKELRIPGTFIGSLPRKPWQNQVMSLPLLLMPEEVSLLLEKGFAYLDSKEIRMDVSDKQLVQDFRSLRDRSQFDQVQLFVRDRDTKRQHFRNKSKGAESKKGEECSDIAKKDMLLERKGASFRGEVLVRKLKNEELSNRGLEITSVTADDLQYYSKSTWIHIPTTVDVNSPLSQSVLKGINNIKWNFPCTVEDKSKYVVFCNLWEKGFYITNGNKFGSDYLLYPGEPSNYHSHYIVKVMLPTENFTPYQLSAYGRLASTVKKTFVLAIVNQNDLSIKYQSIAWTAME